MKNKILNLILGTFFFVVVFGTIPEIEAQVIHTESFDSLSFPPDDWARTGGFNSRWTRVATGNNPPSSPHSGAGMAQFRVGGGPGSNGAQELLISPVVDYTGASGSTPTVSIWMYREGSSTAGDSLSIFVNTSNNLTGATHLGAVARSRFFVLPTNETSDGWYQYTFNIPTSFNTDTNYIMFNGTSRGGGNIYIDDIQWDEYLVACIGTPTAGGVSAVDSLLCGGSGDVNLSLTGSGFSGGGITFQWQSGPSATGPWTDFGPSLSMTNSGTITANTYFRCYVECINGGVTDTSTTLLVEVSPNALPNVTLNVAPVIDLCPGDPPVEVVASGATFYTWTPDISINTTGDSAIANPTANTIYTVIGSDSLGCSSSTSFTINVGTAPAVVATSSLDTICSGDTVTLNAAIQGPPFGNQILWTPGGMTFPNVSVTPALTTTYTVTVSNFFFACEGIDSVTVYVLQSPVAGYSYILNGLTVNFTDTSSTPSGTLTYLWDFDDGTSDTTQNPMHTYTGIGIYNVTLTVSNGMCSNTFTQAIKVGNVGLAQFGNGSSIILYPNPVDDTGIIEFEIDEEIVELQILNTAGQVILSKSLSPLSGTLFKSDIDLSELTVGAYFIRVLTPKESATLKFMKQ